jgi:DNA modification methylase
MNTIIHADCIKGMTELQSDSVDFVLTDPPYLVDYRARDGRTVTNDNNRTWLRPAFREIYRVLTKRCWSKTPIRSWPSAWPMRR